MSNYTDEHDKLAAHLQELYRKHRALDNEIKMLYTKFASNSEVGILKTKKLWLKDEIHLYETKLKALG
jgi:hypothetical protein